MTATIVSTATPATIPYIMTVPSEVLLSSCWVELADMPGAEIVERCNQAQSKCNQARQTRKNLWRFGAPAYNF